MPDLTEGFAAAFRLLFGFDADLWEIIVLSLEVNLAAVVLSCLIGLPLGGALAVYRFRGRKAVIVLVNALMGLPPVVVGLLVYLILSRSGPLGSLNILFTPGAMVIAQAILVTPIVTALTRQIIENLWQDYREQLTSLGSSRRRAIPTLLWDGRTAVLTAVLAGFGRAAAEVGAVIIVGGNIAHHTRTMTTAIALETGRGNLALALGLGIVLVTLAIFLNAAAWMVRERSTPEAALVAASR
ncbi:MAG: ABC transporter permease subunit [Rhodospirillaceae bacterium]|nr:ABC transporter permease subunit [Rhodospirillaceae bacterium]